MQQAFRSAVGHTVAPAKNRNAHTSPALRARVRGIYTTRPRICPFPPSHLTAGMSNGTHSHNAGRCPSADTLAASAHEFCPPQPGDSRSPCPAVNTLANHGYLPRDGKGVTAAQTVDALIACYRLSRPLAWALAYGTILRLRQGTSFDLHDLAQHNVVEHDASLYHPNADGQKYAPIHGDADLLDAFFKTPTDGRVMSPDDIARVRVRREALTPLNAVQAAVARGEMAVILNMFNNPDPSMHSAGVPLQPRSFFSSLAHALSGRHDTAANRGLDGVPINRLRYWFENEQLPPGWEPYHTTTLFDTVTSMSRLQRAMARAQKGKGNASRGKAD